MHAINVGLRPTRDGVATPLRPALHLDILGSFVDILGSFLDILGSFLDILGSFLDNVGRLGTASSPPCDPRCIEGCGLRVEG